MKLFIKQFGLSLIILSLLHCGGGGGGHPVEAPESESVQTLLPDPNRLEVSEETRQTWPPHSKFHFMAHYDKANDEQRCSGVGSIDTARQTLQLIVENNNISFVNPADEQPGEEVLMIDNETQILLAEDALGFQGTLENSINDNCIHRIEYKAVINSNSSVEDCRVSSDILENMQASLNQEENLANNSPIQMGGCYGIRHTFSNNCPEEIKESSSCEQLYALFMIKVEDAVNPNGVGEIGGIGEEPDEREDGGMGEEPGEREDGGMGEEPGEREDGGMGEEPGEREDGGMGEEPGEREDGGMGEEPGEREDGGMGEEPGEREDGGMGEEPGEREDGGMGEEPGEREDGGMGEEPGEREDEPSSPHSAFADNDGDGLIGIDDNCPGTPNPDQSDQDRDGIGDACDLFINNACNNVCPEGSACIDGQCISEEHNLDELSPDLEGPETDENAGGVIPIIPIQVPDSDRINPQDIDNDQVLNIVDNCPYVANPDQKDQNRNGVGDLCEDSDNDGILDASDNCPQRANPDQSNQDGDRYGDVCDNLIERGCPEYMEYVEFNFMGSIIGRCDYTDTDRDGVHDIEDNCIYSANGNQADYDGDGLGNVCDDDRDGDRKLNYADNCPDIYNPSQSDQNQNGVGDFCDRDVDGDGTLNRFDDDCDYIFNPELNLRDNPNITQDMVWVCEA